MKTLTWIALLLITALPAVSAADDLVLSFESSTSDIARSWTFHDIEPGALPAVTFETGGGKGFTVAVMLHDLDEQVLMRLWIYDVTFGRNAPDEPKTILKSDVRAVPSLQVTRDETAYIKQGSADGGWVSVEARVVTTTDAVEE